MGIFHSHWLGKFWVNGVLIGKDGQHLAAVLIDVGGEKVVEQAIEIVNTQLVHRHTVRPITVSTMPVKVKKYKRLVVK